MNRNAVYLLNAVNNVALLMLVVGVVAGVVNTASEVAFLLAVAVLSMTINVLLGNTGRDRRFLYPNIQSRQIFLLAIHSGSTGITMLVLFNPSYHLGDILITAGILFLGPLMHAAFIFTVNVVLEAINWRRISNMY